MFQNHLEDLLKQRAGVCVAHKAPNSRGRRSARECAFTTSYQVTVMLLPVRAHIVRSPGLRSQSWWVAEPGRVPPTPSPAHRPGRGVCRRCGAIHKAGSTNHLPKKCHHPQAGNHSISPEGRTHVVHPFPSKLRAR